jgi:hypothetical protein
MREPGPATSARPDGHPPRHPAALAAGSAALGIAGVNTRPLEAAALGVAGNWGSTLRLCLDRLVEPARPLSGAHLGDRAASRCWARAVYLLDYTYLVCPTGRGARGRGAVRYRPGFRRMCDPATRRLPVYLDSAAYREAVGTAPTWSSYERYRQAIDLIRPDGALAKDVLGDQEASRAGYERLRSDGYGAVVIPVWQCRPTWDDRAGTLLGRGYGAAAAASDAARAAIANARRAARDPVLRAYCATAPLVAIGGLVQGPCPRAARHLYLGELCRQFPETRLRGLGQGSVMVVNGLGQLGLLDRVSTDGTWWLHNARAEQLAVLQDGMIKSIRLTRTGARSFFTLAELMASNLRALLSAYAGLWTFPAPAEVPTDLRDEDARLELRRRLDAVQLDLFTRLEPA